MVVVHIEEEYGYRDWLWETDMSPDEVKEFWRDIQTVSEYFFSGPVSFPGTVTQIYIEGVSGSGVWWRDIPAERKKKVYYWISAKSGESHANISMPEDVWTAHIHMECDSWLKPRDEDIIRHAGYVPDDEYFSEDYEPSEEAVAASEVAIAAQIAYIRECAE